MINFNVRDYNDEDYEFIYDLKKQVYIKYIEENWSKWNESLQRDLFVKFIDTNKNTIKIIICDNRDIGFYHGEILENGDYEIGNICIVPEYQGKRNWYSYIKYAN